VKQDSGEDRHHQGRLRRTALAAALVGTTLLAVAACGGAHSTAPKASSGQLTAQKVDAFAKCMRSHGVPNFYPSRAGSQSASSTSSVIQLGPWTFTGANLSSPQFTSALSACRHLAGLPSGPPPPLTATQIHSLIEAAECMRTHGYPDYPDPDIQDGHLVRPSLPTSIDTSSPQFQAALQTCRSGNV
jgi:hypothetical protein